MVNTVPGGIWPPHEAFYIESMLHCTTAALRAAQDVQQALEFGSSQLPSSEEWRECALTIVNGIQVIVVQAAAISRYFWPASKKEPHLARAARLRAGLGISESSVLKNRDLRNSLEHFDERLDVFCSQLMAGVILPTYVDPMRAEPEVPTYLFRAYYTDVAVFEILGRRFEVQPMLDEVQELHVRLERAGSRIPGVPNDRSSP